MTESKAQTPSEEMFKKITSIIGDLIEPHKEHLQTVEVNFQNYLLEADSIHVAGFVNTGGEMTIRVVWGVK